MKKHIIALALVFMLVFSMAANAAVQNKNIVPNLSFSGTTAYCSVSVVEAGADIEVTLTLYRGSTVVDSWTGSGVSYVSINETCKVTSGKTYTLKVSGTVDGEDISGSVSGTC